MIVENRKPTLLIVDDSSDIIANLFDILKDEYSIKIATSGEKALEFFQKGNTTDLILLDVIMPNMDGFEVCAKLKKYEKTKQIPIIFLTALEDEHDIIKGLELGAVDYIPKPYNIYVLKARVRSHITLKLFQDDLINTINEKDNLLLKQSKMAMLGEMFENIAHQWKQPISIISSACNNLEFDIATESLSNDKVSQQVQIIHDALMQQTQTITTFRDFIKSDNTHIDFSPYELIEECKILLRSKIINNNINIVNNISPQLICFNDRSALLQVIFNILGNSIHALKNISGERNITITSINKAKSFILSFSDNGGGINDIYSNKIFEKYFTTKDSQEGSGLGLYMSKQIINKMGGNITFKNIENGICFNIELDYKNKRINKENT